MSFEIGALSDRLNNQMNSSIKENKNMFLGEGDLFSLSLINNFTSQINTDENINISHFQKDILLSKSPLVTERNHEGCAISPIHENSFDEPNTALIYLNTNNIHIKTKDKNLKSNTKQMNKYINQHYIKYFKSNYLKWFIKIINSKIERIEGNKIKKINKQEFNDFISVSCFERNKKFLKIRCKDILNFLNKDKKTNINELINKIYKDPEKYKLIIIFLEQTIEESMRDFYESEDFKTFKSNQITLNYENLFAKKNNASFIDKYGYIKYFNSNNKEK